MTKKVYRSAQGKIVDLGSLILQNENTRAVGNMKVNARGDLLDSQNRPVSTRNQQVAKQYNRQVSTTNVSDQQVVTSRRQAEENKPREKKKEKAPAVEASPEMLEPVLEQPEPVAPGPTVLPEGGLAAAIAKARQIKQEPLKTPRQQAQEKDGVRKI